MVNSALLCHVMLTFTCHCWLVLELVGVSFGISLSSFRCTGFILDGFPSNVEEVQYIGERGFFTDIAVFLEADESDICDRLLPPRLAKWQERRRRKEDRKRKLTEMKKKIRVPSECQVLKKN